MSDASVCLQRRLLLYGTSTTHMCRCRSVVVSEVELFAPATTWIPNEIHMECIHWNSHGRRSKLLQRPWPFER
jgi:hypothetical protein